MKKFKILVDKPQLDLIVKHLNKGVYEEVAQFLSDLRQQIQEQLPKPKTPKPIPASERSLEKVNGSASRYARSP